jgi:hypothetical protein
LTIQATRFQFDCDRKATGNAASFFTDPLDFPCKLS